MFQGQPLFPGVSNILEQLERIWEVRGKKSSSEKKKYLLVKLGTEFALDPRETDGLLQDMAL